MQRIREQIQAVSSISKWDTLVPGKCSVVENKNAWLVNLDNGRSPVVSSVSPMITMVHNIHYERGANTVGRAYLVPQHVGRMLMSAKLNCYYNSTDAAKSVVVCVKLDFLDKHQSCRTTLGVTTTRAEAILISEDNTVAFDITRHVRELASLCKKGWELDFEKSCAEEWGEKYESPLFLPVVDIARVLEIGKNLCKIGGWKLCQTMMVVMDSIFGYKFADLETAWFAALNLNAKEIASHAVDIAEIQTAVVKENGSGNTNEEWTNRTLFQFFSCSSNERCRWSDAKFKQLLSVAKNMKMGNWHLPALKARSTAQEQLWRTTLANPGKCIHRRGTSFWESKSKHADPVVFMPRPDQDRVIFNAIKAGDECTCSACVGNSLKKFIEEALQNEKQSDFSAFEDNEARTSQLSCPLWSFPNAFGTMFAWDSANELGHMENTKAKAHTYTCTFFKNTCGDKEFIGTVKVEHFRGDQINTDFMKKALSNLDANNCTSQYRAPGNPTKDEVATECNTYEEQLGADAGAASVLKAIEINRAAVEAREAALKNRQIVADRGVKKERKSGKKALKARSKAEALNAARRAQEAAARCAAAAAQLAARQRSRTRRIVRRSERRVERYRAAALIVAHLRGMLARRKANKQRELRKNSVVTKATPKTMAKAAAHASGTVRSTSIPTGQDWHRRAPKCIHGAACARYRRDRCDFDHSDDPPPQPIRAGEAVPCLYGSRCTWFLQGRCRFNHDWDKRVAVSKAAADASDRVRAKELARRPAENSLAEFKAPADISWPVLLVRKASVDCVPFSADAKKSPHVSAPSAAPVQSAAPTPVQQLPVQQVESKPTLSAALSPGFARECPICFECIHEAYALRCGHLFCSGCAQACCEMARCAVCNRNDLAGTAPIRIYL